MKSISHARLKHFESKKQFLNTNNAAFSVHSSGLSKKIKYTDSDYGMLFCDSRIKGAFICRMVRSDINKYIEANGPIKGSITDKNYIVTRFNPELIEKNLHLPMKAIDCNYFYFQIAYNLGFISKNTFEKGISKREEYKQARLSAIGGLNKLELIEHFSNGQKIGEESDWITYNKFSPFYWRVIRVASDLMDEIFEKFPDDMCMWLTDCCYTTIESEKRIIDFITSKGYGIKTFGIDFQYLEWNEVGWYDCKEGCSKKIKFTKYQTY